MIIWNTSGILRLIISGLENTLDWYFPYFTRHHHSDWSQHIDIWLICWIRNSREMVACTFKVIYPASLSYIYLLRTVIELFLHPSYLNNLFLTYSSVIRIYMLVGSFLVIAIFIAFLSIVLNKFKRLRNPNGKFIAYMDNIMQI